MSVLCCRGLSFHQASIACRERLAWSPAVRQQIATECLQMPGVEEAFVLVTCHRTEIYVVGGDPATTSMVPIEVITRINPDMATVLQQEGYQWQGAAAMHHLFRVAASLDAMVVGEPQILGQLKAAYHEARAAAQVGPYLHRIMQRAFAAAKRVRHETGIGLKPVSVASVAIELAQQIFGDLSSCAIMLLGIGEMSRLLIRHLHAAGALQLTVVSRTPSHPAQLADGCEATWSPWEMRGQLLQTTDIVIAATAASAAVIDVAMVRQALAHRQRPIFFLDLAMPRNVAPDIANLPNVYVYNLDDLQTVADANMTARRAEVEHAEMAIAQAAEACLGEVDQFVLAPTIAQLHRKCETIRREEVTKTLARFPAFPPTLQAAMEACTTAIVSKILHDPVLQLKEAEKQPAPQVSEEMSSAVSAVEWLKRFFRLNESVS